MIDYLRAIDEFMRLAGVAILLVGMAIACTVAVGWLFTRRIWPGPYDG